MSAAYNPFGLKPIYHPTGLDRATPFTGTISTANNLYQFTPVAIDSTGALVLGQATGAAAGTTYGVVDGFEYTDASGRRAVSKWFGAALGTATNTIAWVWTDADLVYEIQANGPVNASAVGREFNLVNVGNGQIIGNGGLGQSTAALDSTGPVAAGTQGVVLVLGLGRGIDNAWGDSNTVVQVKIAETRITAPVPSASA